MYEIEKSVPIPERQKAGRFPYEQLEVNDSFVVQGARSRTNSLESSPPSAPLISIVRFMVFSFYTRNKQYRLVTAHPLLRLHRSALLFPYHPHGW